jgi:hypothetical protein
MAPPSNTSPVFIVGVGVLFCLFSASKVLIIFETEGKMGEDNVLFLSFFGFFLVRAENIATFAAQNGK